MSLSVTVTARCDGCGSKITATGRTRGFSCPHETVDIRMAQRGWAQTGVDHYSCETCQAYKRRKLKFKPEAQIEEVPCRTVEHRLARTR